VGLAIIACDAFLAGRRVLYAVPTTEQLDKFWFEVKRAFSEAIEARVLVCNETKHTIELPRSETRIRAKTAWNADMLRGDYADLLILDEWQLMNEDVWETVGAPMLADNAGDAIFVYTPPSPRRAGISKARDPRHAAKMFKAAQVDTTGLWQAFHFTSYDNPYISREGLAAVTQDMSLDAYRREIMAEDDEIEASWLVYSAFDEARCKIKPFAIPRSWPVYTGHDFGTANPAAIFLAQNPGPDEPRVSTGAQVRKGDFVLWAEYAPGPGRSAFEHVAAFREMSHGYTVQRSVGGNLTTEEEIRQAYTAHGWPIQPPKFARVQAQIDRVIGLMELNKLLVFETCHQFLAQLSNCMWELDEERQVTNKVKDESRYHLLAAMRYILSDFAPETQLPLVKERPVWRM